MSDPDDLGPVPTRVALDATQVQRLVAGQFPQWAGLSVRPVAESGWDNQTFHLGDDMLVRLPSAAEYAGAVEKEHRWLPRLAPRLPLPIPVPVGRGEPGEGYAHPWSVYAWLPGRTATADRIADPVRFATDLADFLVALQSVDPSEGPQPGLHNWFRGGPLTTFDDATRRCLRELEELVDADRLLRVWDETLDAPWDGIDCWFHGDVAEGNLLVDDAGRLGAVIDFGTCGVGDPACDLAIAWTLLTPLGRRAFRDRLQVDDDTWKRGRGWALWKAAADCRTAVGGPTRSDEVEKTSRVLRDVLEEQG